MRILQKGHGDRRTATVADRGAVATIVLIMMLPVLMASAAIGIDIANWYWQAGRLQVAADAAATAGVVYLPGDPTLATAAAKALAGSNGFPEVTGKTTVSAVQQTKLSQVKVTITTTITNSFGGLFGSPTQSITKHAVADYAGPVPMGSPCNIFGNEPDPGVLNPGSVASANCTFGRTPNFWASIAGPGLAKEQGDQFASRVCTGGALIESGCVSTTNSEFYPRGYFYKVSVTAAVPSISFQVFDPIYAVTGLQCTDNLNTNMTSISDTVNDYVTDAKNRYKAGNTGTPGTFCTGDANWASQSSDANNAFTTFTVRSPSQFADPVKAPIVPGCSQQYKGYNGGQSNYSTSSSTLTNLEKRLTKGNASYDDAIARTFRQWAALCTISNPSIGDYYIQVRTDIASTATGGLDAAMDSAAGTSLTWNGQNHFALRAKSDTLANDAKVSVAGADRMAIFANVTSSTAKFYLARVGPGSAGRQLVANVFDVGDATGAPPVTIYAPSDAGTTSSLSCKEQTISGSTVTLTALTGCSRIFHRLAGTGYPGDNGQLRTFIIQIPTTYTCNEAVATDCWFRISVGYTSTTTDATTWSVKLNGNPVRLIE